MFGMRNKAMSCEENREKISSLLDAELSGKEKQMLEKHLYECITCRTLKEWLRCVKEGIARSANEVVISDSVREKILAALDQLPSETPAVPWWKRLLSRF
jgi:anti-sigma factor RsiW